MSPQDTCHAFKLDRLVDLDMAINPFFQVQIIDTSTSVCTNVLRTDDLLPTQRKFMHLAQVSTAECILTGWPRFSRTIRFFPRISCR